MKKIIAIVLALVLALTLVACGGGGGEETKTYKIAVMVPYIGDQSFFDAFNSGRIVLDARDDVEAKLFEMGTDQTKWEAFFDDVCDGEVKYDLVATGSTEVEPFLYAAAAKYPDQLFFNYDYTDAAVVGQANVYGVTYNTADLGYVAGVAASLITTSDMEKANADKKVGVIVGMDNVYMNDFIGGFCQVCNEYGVQVFIGYPVSATPFNDPAQGKELSAAMYNAGVDVIWQVAGGTGSGVFQAAADADMYSLGVDVDQSLTFANQPELAKTIVTSFFKDCGGALIYAVDQLIAGTYPAGELQKLGIAEKAVGYFENDQYKAMVPESVRTEIAAALAKVANGEVDVYSVIAEPDKWEAIKTAAIAAK